MLDTSARLLRLLSLFQARRYWSGTEVSERLEVTPRTLRRDVDRLRSLGYPVNSTSATSGGYRLAPGSTLPPLLLDDEEAVAVAVGLRTAASGTVTGIEEASVRALSKLQQVLPAPLRRRVTALHSFILPLASTGPTVDAETLSVIAGACRDYEKLCFAYLSREGAATTREVEPHRLAHTGRRWYLAAWDVGRDDWRTFRVDRIEPGLTTGRRFTPRKPPDGDFAAYVAHRRRRCGRYAPPLVGQQNLARDLPAVRPESLDLPHLGDSQHHRRHVCSPSNRADDRSRSAAVPHSASRGPACPIAG